MQRVVCDDGCKQEFVLIEMGTKKIHDDVEFVGFSCPHCGKLYGHYQNDKIKMMQQEQRKLLKLGKRAKGQALRKVLQRIESKKAEIKAEMDRLRTEVEVENHAES